MSAERGTINTRIGLLELARSLGNVSQACKMMGYSRDSFYRFREMHAIGGDAALRDTIRRKPISRIRIPADLETAAVEMALEHPGWGQYRAAGELSKQGRLISPGGVRCIWARHQLETMKKRLQALHNRGHDAPPTPPAHTVEPPEATLHEELENDWPGDCCAQAIYCVGSWKGIGRIYQQTFVDAFSAVGFAALYPQNHPMAGVDFLNSRVFPFFEQQNVPLRQIVTDCGAEYCGVAERHPYELCLALQNIHHVRTTEKNAICEPFQATLREEFYETVVRRTSYASLQQLQRDLDTFIDEYNFRPHGGRRCGGKTPMQTFRAHIRPASLEHREHGANYA
jgi:hypothetical protein